MSVFLLAVLTLRDVFAPHVTGIPPNYAHRDLCQLPDGEIRHYGWQLEDGERRFVYSASRDNGLSWKTLPAETNDVGAMVRSPWSGDWLTILNDGQLRAFVVRSKTFPATPAARKVQLDTEGFAFCRQPQPLGKRGHWICAGQRFPVTDADRQSGYECPGVLLSKDDGLTWKLVLVSNVVTQAAEPLVSDAVPRWENYCCEPTVCELGDGTLLMIARTSTDHVWCYRSADGGENWTGPERMPWFYATNTMPTLFRLKDGRLIFFWNNAVPLPKTRTVTGLPLSPDEARGRWETVFTNRDVLHAAISEDDGRTWIGFREILLNEHRNDADFRELGNDGIQEPDKSVHQCQAVELPGGKVLVSAGQNVAARRFVVFDPDWLYENSREEDFRQGLGNVCDHLYVKGPMGGMRGWAGHCAWNRVHGARLTVDPDLPENQREVVHLVRRGDADLVSDLPGLVWNFPTGRRGRVEVEARLPSGSRGFRLTLSDHWFNPCDRAATERETARVDVTSETIAADHWVTVVATWDSETKSVVFSADGRRLAELPLADPPHFGFSYLHLQLLADDTDLKGVYFRRLAKTDGAEPVGFAAAKPVWPEGRARMMNDFVTFRGSFEASPSKACVLRLTGSTCYRVRLNGNFLAFGPARGPKGMFRVDEIPLGGLLADGTNRVEVDVQGANVNSYEYMDQPSFLQAEVVCGNRVLLATGSGFEAFDTHERVRKVSRFNFQRLFAEAYRIGKSDRSEKLHLETRPTVRLLPRRVPFPAYEVDRSFRKAKTLRRRHDPSAEVWVGREISQVGEKGYKGYRPEELEINVNSEVQRYVADPSGDIEATVWRGRKVSAGFVGLEVRCTRPGRLVAFLAESERTNLAVGSNDGGFPVFWDIAEPGDYVLESFVPNSMMFVETFFDGGAVDVESVWVREFKSSLPFNRKFAGNDPELRTIYEAAAESLAQNAVDVYTDCPGRERAAWIGDTFFTGRAGRHLIGSTVVEDAFLENYALAERFDDIPDGALPMVYPGEHPDKVFIPNFCMWFGAQVAEYAQRGGDPAIVAALKPKLLGFVRYADGFLNADGLLENLPGWVFLEWSKASDRELVKGVNYPSNMQYAGMLAALAELYGDKSLGKRAAELRRTIRAKSWNGEWFRDSAASETCTECCQYYAFFFGVADFTRDRDLWERLVAKCGPLRDAKTVYPDLAPANSIFGYFMRFDMLLRTGRRDVLEREAKAYFLPMAQATGTIWENKDARGSNSHGLSSIAAYFVDPPACRCEQGKGQR